MNTDNITHEELLNLCKNQWELIQKLLPEIGQTAFDDFGLLNDVCLISEKLFKEEF